MRFLILPTLVFATFSLTGCASHQMMRGSVAMKTTDREAHVCLGENEVKVGDHVTAYRNECKPIGSNLERPRGKTSCKLEKMGGGKVISILNDHYSTVEFDQGVAFNEGTVVQKE